MGARRRRRGRLAHVRAGRVDHPRRHRALGPDRSTRSTRSSRSAAQLNAGTTSAASEPQVVEVVEVEHLEVDGLGACVAVLADRGRSPRPASPRSARAARSRRRGRCAAARRSTSASSRPAHHGVGDARRQRRGVAADRLARGGDASDDLGERLRRRERDVELVGVARREVRRALGAEPADDDRRPGLLHRLRQRGGVVDRVVRARRRRSARRPAWTTGR